MPKGPADRGYSSGGGLGAMTIGAIGFGKAVASGAARQVGRQVGQAAARRAASQAIKANTNAAKLGLSNRERLSLASRTGESVTKKGSWGTPVRATRAIRPTKPVKPATARQSAKAAERKMQDSWGPEYGKMWRAADTRRRMNSVKSGVTRAGVAAAAGAASRSSSGKGKYVKGPGRK